MAREIGESQNFRADAEYRHEAWININPPSAWNQIHIHPNCHLSGCYYVRVPANSGGICFRDPRKLSLMARPPLESENLFHRHGSQNAAGTRAHVCFSGLAGTRGGTEPE